MYKNSKPALSKRKLMFNVLTTCVSFDYVVNFENEWNFINRDFIVPTSCVLPTHPNNYEASKDFLKFFVISSYNQS